MDTNFIWLLIAAAAVTLGYYRWLLTKTSAKKEPQLQLSNHAPVPAEQLIGKPVVQATAKQPINFIVDDGPEEEEELQPLETDDSMLLRAAENVVEQIQETLHHIASSPPNMEEITSKIRAILSQYSIFLNTEYFDAINTFVCVTAERECQVKLTPLQVEPLWNK